MDFEIGHINISMPTAEQKREGLATIVEKTSRDADEGVAGCPCEDDKPIVDWHTDSYPFVCVTMLSDCTNMVGGETALRTGKGEVMKVRGPQMVRRVPYSSLTGLLNMQGMCRCAPRPLHRTSGSPCTWYQ